MEKINKIDITDFILEGDLEEILPFLIELFSLGYRKIDFDIYNSSIKIFKTNENEKYIDLTNVINEFYVRKKINNEFDDRK